MDNLYIKSERVYYNSKFDMVKNIFKKNLYTFKDVNSFIDIEFQNYNFMLTEILDLDIYIKQKDDLLEKRIIDVERNIKSIIKDFKFESYNLVN